MSGFPTPKIIPISFKLSIFDKEKNDSAVLSAHFLGSRHFVFTVLTMLNILFIQERKRLVEESNSEKRAG